MGKYFPVVNFNFTPYFSKQRNSIRINHTIQIIRFAIIVPYVIILNYLQSVEGFVLFICFLGKLYFEGFIIHSQKRKYP